MAATISITYGVSVCCIQILPSGNTVFVIFSCNSMRDGDAVREHLVEFCNMSTQAVLMNIMLSIILLASFTDNI